MDFRSTYNVLGFGSCRSRKCIVFSLGISSLSYSEEVLLDRFRAWNSHISVWVKMNSFLVYSFCLKCVHFIYQGPYSHHHEGIGPVWVCSAQLWGVASQTCLPSQSGYHRAALHCCWSHRVLGQVEPCVRRGVGLHCRCFGLASKLLQVHPPPWPHAKATWDCPPVPLSLSDTRDPGSNLASAREWLFLLPCSLL